MRSTPAAAGVEPEASPARVLVGGVGRLWQGDFDFGRLAAERLAAQDLGEGAVVEDLFYGGVGVAWRLDELKPAALVLVGAADRGRPPGTVERREVTAPKLAAADQGSAVGEAITGYVSIDLLVEVAAAFGVLPARTVAVEVEPASREPSHELSPVCAAALPSALELVRAEVGAVFAAT